MESFVRRAIPCRREGLENLPQTNAASVTQKGDRYPFGPGTSASNPSEGSYRDNGVMDRVHYDQYSCSLAAVEGGEAPASRSTGGGRPNGEGGVTFAKRDDGQERVIPAPSSHPDVSSV